jgi:3-oxoadipate enol-lactonase
MTDDHVVRLHHEIDGDPTAPAVVLGPSLGTGLDMWASQVEALTQRWRVVRFDPRGHGGSPVPVGPYSVEGLAADVVALVDELGIDQFAYCGLSLGGAIGQQLALTQPDRVRSLVLCCTAARFGEPEGWHERATRVRAEGTEWLVDTTRERWFTEDFRSREPQQTQRLLAMLRDTPSEGYAGCCDALAEFDTRDALVEIKAPTLVIAGESDPATPPALAEELTEGIEDASLLMLSPAAHLATVERAEPATRAIVEHLERTCP